MKVDPKRVDLPETGIYVRAQDDKGKWGAHDISHLDTESLRAWINSKKDKDYEFLTEVVLHILGH